jgi:hypothetical protein
MKTMLALFVIILFPTPVSACERSGSFMTCKNTTGKTAHRIKYKYKTDIPVNQTIHNNAGAVIFAKSWCNDGPPKIEAYEQRHDLKNGSSRTGPLKKRYYWECSDTKRTETTLDIDGKGKLIHCNRVPHANTWIVDVFDMEGGREKWESKVNQYGVSCPIPNRPTLTNKKPVSPSMMTYSE